VLRLDVEGLYTVSGAAFSLPLNDSHYFLHRLLVSASSREPPKTLRKPCADTNTSHCVAGCRTPFTALRQVLYQAECCGYLMQGLWYIQTYFCCYLL
jgi:hypothetical protein